MGKITEFYLSKKPDDIGRMIDDIWIFDNDHLETTHDYIQWLFPLKEKSLAVPNAPIIEDEEIEEFRNNAYLSRRVLHSLDVMLQFYGFERNDDEIIGFATDFPDRCVYWQGKNNHNYLRLTRIMRCLVLMNLSLYAYALHSLLLKCAMQKPEDFSEITLDFWRKIFEE